MEEGLGRPAPSPAIGGGRQHLEAGHFLCLSDGRPTDGTVLLGSQLRPHRPFGTLLRTGCQLQYLALYGVSNLRGRAILGFSQRHLLDTSEVGNARSMSEVGLEGEPTLRGVAQRSHLHSLYNVALGLLGGHDHLYDLALLQHPHLIRAGHRLVQRCRLSDLVVLLHLLGVDRPRIPLGRDPTLLAIFHGLGPYSLQAGVSGIHRALQDLEHLADRDLPDDLALLGV
mmetsp:Transcript_12736/g.36556  ORF Transcript_12736/g.36556 Transcript_12736/m.36556 type:complete len:227 (-) Transcript_12736:1911-2591(-)